MPTARSSSSSSTTAVNSPTNYAGQTGSVDASPPPPGVPDGAPGSQPLRVTKVVPDGSSLSISFDTATCAGSSDHHILYGGKPELPAAAGGTFGVLGSACALGATSPYVWNPAPAEDVVVAGSGARRRIEADG